MKLQSGRAGKIRQDVQVAVVLDRAHRRNCHDVIVSDGNVLCYSTLLHYWQLETGACSVVSALCCVTGS